MKVSRRDFIRTSAVAGTVANPILAKAGAVMGSEEAMGRSARLWHAGRPPMQLKDLPHNTS